MSYEITITPPSEPPITLAIAQGGPVGPQGEPGLSANDERTWVIGEYTQTNLANRLAASGGTSTALLSTVDHGTSTYVRNAALWLGTDLDLTGIPVYTGPTARSRGALVTRQHLLVANHYPPVIGAPVRFVDSAGAVVERSVTAIRQLGSTDGAIAVLDAPVPATVTPYQLAPATLNYSGTATRGIVVDSEGKVLAQRVTPNSPNYANAQLTTGDLAAVSEALVSGDSGSPFALVLNGQVMLVGCAFTTLAGPLAAALIAQITAAVAPEGYAAEVYDANPWLLGGPAGKHRHTQAEIDGLTAELLSLAQNLAGLTTFAEYTVNDDEIELDPRQVYSAHVVTVAGGDGTSNTVVLPSPGQYTGHAVIVLTGAVAGANLALTYYDINEDQQTLWSATSTGAGDITLRVTQDDNRWVLLSVETPTAAANATPRAGSGGTLDPAWVPNASDTAAGKVRLATAAEAVALAGGVALTPERLRTVLHSRATVQIPLAPQLGTSSVTGTGSMQGGAGSLGPISQATANSTVVWRMNANSHATGLQRGVNCRQFNWTRGGRLAFAAAVDPVYPATSATGWARLCLGRASNSVALQADITALGASRLVGIEWEGATAPQVYLCVANGTTGKRVIATGVTMTNALQDCELVWDGVGNASLYVDDVMVATTDGAPNAISAAIDCGISVELTNGATAAQWGCGIFGPLKVSA